VQQVNNHVLMCFKIQAFGHLFTRTTRKLVHSVPDGNCAGFEKTVVEISVMI
jgi:hypothetical protein